MVDINFIQLFVYFFHATLPPELNTESLPGGQLYPAPVQGMQIE